MSIISSDSSKSAIKIDIPRNGYIDINEIEPDILNRIKKASVILSYDIKKTFRILNKYDIVPDVSIIKGKYIDGKTLEYFTPQAQSHDLIDDWLYLNDFCYKTYTKAYKTELEVIYPLLLMEIDGIPLDLKWFNENYSKYTYVLSELTADIQEETQALNPVGCYAFYREIQAKGIIDKTEELEAEDKKSVSIKNLLHYVKSDSLYEKLKYRIKIKNDLSLLSRLHTYKEKPEWFPLPHRGNGSVTGRITSLPMMQNLSREIYKSEYLTKYDTLKSVREIIYAPEGYTLVSVDYKQQDLRSLFLILQKMNMLLMKKTNNVVSYEDLTNTDLDLYEIIRSKLDNAYTRDDIKKVVLSIVGGMGDSKLSLILGKLVREAKYIKKVVIDAIPNLDYLMKILKTNAEVNKRIPSLYGRNIPVDQPYKSVIMASQSSSADLFKTALINIGRLRFLDIKPILLLFDEILLLVPSNNLNESIKEIKRAVKDEVDPVLDVSIKTGSNFADLKEYKT